MAKRVFDILFSITVLTAVLPFMVIFAVWVKLDSKGPIFYLGSRVGRSGKSFGMFKFRTMVVDADVIGGPSSGDDDPRITKVGKILRRSKFDEVPELINVLKGDMSLVGPRPEVLQEVELYSEEERALLTVRPGITDYASIRFNDEGEILAGAEDPHQTYLELIRPEKVRLGLEYVHSHSFLGDLKIIAKTFTTLMGSRLGRDR